MTRTERRLYWKEVLRSNVRRYMERNALSFRDLAVLSGYRGPGGIHNCIIGPRFPHMVTIIDIAAALGVTPADLLTPPLTLLNEEASAPVLPLPPVREDHPPR